MQNANFDIRDVQTNFLFLRIHRVSEFAWARLQYAKTKGQKKKEDEDGSASSRIRINLARVKRIVVRFCASGFARVETRQSKKSVIRFSRQVDLTRGLPNGTRARLETA